MPELFFLPVGTRCGEFLKTAIIAQKVFLFLDKAAHRMCAYCVEHLIFSREKKHLVLFLSHIDSFYY